MYNSTLKTLHFTHLGVVPASKAGHIMVLVIGCDNVQINGRHQPSIL